MELEKALKYVDAHLFEEISLELLGKMMGYSPWYVYKLFKLHTGESLAAYIRKRRLLWAVTKMEHESNLLEMAMSCGFETAAGFNKAFWKQFNCSPSEYKLKYVTQNSQSTAILYQNGAIEMEMEQVKIIGVGDGGINTVDALIESGFDGVSFIAANTCAASLKKTKASICVQLGEKITRGRDASGKPEIGRAAAEDSRKLLESTLDHTDMLYIVAGMGGGTGTGAAPMIGESARKRGIFTIGLCFAHFRFECGERIKIAEAGIDEFRKNVDLLIVMPNESMVDDLDNASPTFSLPDVMRQSCETMAKGVRGFIRVFQGNCLISLEVDDLRVAFPHGVAYMGIGHASGEDMHYEALKQARERYPEIKSAKTLVIGFFMNSKASLMALSSAVGRFNKFYPDDAEIWFGVNIDESIEDEVIATVIADRF